MDLCNKIFKFKTIGTPSKNGVLHCLNELDFNTKRIFYIDGFDKNCNDTRGEHANIECDEFLFICNGSLELSLTNQKNETTSFHLSKNEGIVINKMIWLEFNSNDDKTLVMVLCNTIFETDRNITDFNAFLTYDL